MPRGVLTRAIINRKGHSVFVNNNVTRIQFKYKEPSYHMNKYGYCCESIVLFNRRTNTYKTESSNAESITLTCKLTRLLDLAIADHGEESDVVMY